MYENLAYAFLGAAGAILWIELRGLLYKRRLRVRTKRATPITLGNWLRLRDEFDIPAIMKDIVVNRYAIVDTSPLFGARTYELISLPAFGTDGRGVTHIRVAKNPVVLDQIVENDPYDKY